MSTETGYVHTTSVALPDAILVLLDGHVDEKVQEKVDAAKDRLAAAADLHHLDPMQAGFVADVLREANQSGRLILRRVRIRRCDLCGTTAGHGAFKSGPRKSQPNYDRPPTLDGYDLADRIVRMEGYARLGGCAECVVPLLGDVAEGLRGVPAEVPERLRAEGEPRRKKHRNRHCTKCDWTGHEGQMGLAPTIMGDGYFPAFCPSCGAGGVFSRDVASADGFAVVVESPPPGDAA